MATGLLSALDDIVSGRHWANCAPKFPSTVISLFWSCLFFFFWWALLDAKNSPRWRFSLHRIFLSSGPFLCAASGVISHGFERPATAPWIRCLQENLKEVTFSEEGWGRGRMLGRDDWVTVGAAQQNARHLAWTSAWDRWGAEKNKAGQVPAEPRPPSQCCLTRRKQMPVWSIFFPRGLKRKEKEKRPEQTDCTSKISFCQRHNGSIKGNLSPQWVFIHLKDKRSSQMLINDIKSSTALAAKTNNESDKWEECVLVSRAVLCGHLS